MEGYLYSLFQNAVTTVLTKAGLTVDATLSNAMFKDSDISATRFADFQYNGIIRVYQKLKQTLQTAGSTSPTLEGVASELIALVADADKPNGVIGNMNLSKNFININLNNSFILESLLSYGAHLVKNGPKQYSLLKTEREKKDVEQKKARTIVFDYSSPNVAKSLHIGHLRSTIIGETIIRMHKNAGHNVVGLNHVGDWGTQFGMIINFLKQKYSDQKELMIFLDSAKSEDLMNVYRQAKTCFDNKDAPEFADDSRQQTHLLQQNDEFNTEIWKKICAISSVEYSNIYKMLNIQNLVERGESFYRSIIPAVINLLTEAGLTRVEQGATIIMLEGWTYPLMVIKSDGGYTYDTTDLAALYHRLCVLNVDEVVYITDAGQKTHFDMCFEVAKKMGWTKPLNEFDPEKQLVHIGFGLVCGKDGKKLKTRSGDVVKMLDVIDEVVQLSESVIRKRAEECQQKGKDDGKSENDSTTSYYQSVTDSDIKDMSRKIGINTLKYFDLSHSCETNYKYDPELMFRFNGDTGVYLMYCFARINGIIEKSSVVKEYKIDRKDPSSSTSLFTEMASAKIDPKYLTKETRDLMIHINNFSSCLDTATSDMNPTKLTNYLYNLCTLFNTFITQKGGKIIGSENEKIGITICLIVSRIIEGVFDLLSFEQVEHI
ncbi:Arginyl-tRNA Synthetase [Yasminevirus sp. GU-2018]|uniref:arginine--tRNA ligase n=1 Tax=Yasminevirus sp. GU-2018 TaxID=2420051 RepID=A0A5K0UAR8_9VIRU|nr:Arginyl-tRNA Synthetase [Yasminevirus sp. GU-2018]